MNKRIHKDSDACWEPDSTVLTELKMAAISIPLLSFLSFLSLILLLPLFLHPSSSPFTVLLSLLSPTVPLKNVRYMHNVMPRKFYTFKFLAGEKNYVKTPSYLTVNMHSAMPGDYVYLSIPYPPSAVPFNITQSNQRMLKYSHESAHTHTHARNPA